MWLLIAEAFLALGLLIFIVWWTMSSRRKPSRQADADAALPPAADTEASGAPVVKRDGEVADRG